MCNGLGGDDDDDVLLAAPGIVRPVGRARPDGLAVADDVLVVHEIRNARDPLRRHVQTVDQRWLAAWRRRDGDGPLVVDVEREPDRYAFPGRIGECARHQTRGRLLEVEVVEGQVERLPGPGDELTDVLGDLEGALAPVGQCVDLDRQA
jgi:hypothetical protein